MYKQTNSPLVNHRWAKEARDLPPDPVTGARLTRLTGSALFTHNIYCDAPRTTPDGKRVAAIRYSDHLLSQTKALLCIDLTTKYTHLIDAEMNGWPVSPAWGGSVYYPRGTELMRASLDTCQTEPIFDLNEIPPCWQLMSLTPDERFLLYTATVQESPEAYNLVRLDLRDGTWSMLLDEPNTVRVTGAFDPATGNDMMIVGCFWEGKNRKSIGLMADGHGKNARPIFDHCHHGGWTGDGRNLVMLREFDADKFAHLPENPDGELMIYPKDGSKPRLVPVPDHLFLHISSSRCGRYTVSQSLENGLSFPVPIVVVNIETGKYRTLVSDCRCSIAGDDSRQVKPYFTADNRHVIYTADPDGIVNVYAAEIPSGFLESLN